MLSGKASLPTSWCSRESLGCFAPLYSHIYILGSLCQIPQEKKTNKSNIWISIEIELIID